MKYILALLLASLPAFAQESRAGYIPNSVSVSAEGDFDSAPDTAVVTCSISAQEKTSQAAFDSASRLADQLRQALRKAGIDPKAAELSSYNLYPVLDYKDPRQRVIAYRVGTSVTVKLKDFGKIAALTESLAGLEGISGQNMSYELEDIDAAKQKAIDKAYARARSYAETLAKTSGRHLGGLVAATVDIQQPMPVVPYARMAVMGQAAKAPGPTEEFQAEKIKVTAHVSAVFGLE